MSLISAFNPFPLLKKNDDFLNKRLQGINLETGMGASVPYQYKTLIGKKGLFGPTVYHYVRDYETEEKMLIEKLMTMNSPKTNLNKGEGDETY